MFGLSREERVRLEQERLNRSGRGGPPARGPPPPSGSAAGGGMQAPPPAMAAKRTHSAAMYDDRARGSSKYPGSSRGFPTTASTATATAPLVDATSSADKRLKRTHTSMLVNGAGARGAVAGNGKVLAMMEGSSDVDGDDNTRTPPTTSRAPRPAPPATVPDPLPATPDLPYVNGHFLMIAGDGPAFKMRVRFVDLVDPAQDTLQGSILSSFVWDDEWLWSRMPSDIPTCLVRTDMTPEEVAQLPKHIRVCTPPIVGYGCMHVKFMVLVYPGFVRVCISSANLYEQDWGALENIAFVQDFPQTSTKQAQPKEKVEFPFYTQFSHVLDSLCVPKSVYGFLRHFDYSRFRGKLIFSRHGTFPSTRAEHLYGLCALNAFVREAVPELATTITTPLTVDAVTSSLGLLNDRDMVELKQCFRGTFMARNGIPVREDRIRIMFPTRETVLSSKHGVQGGASIFFQPKYFSNKNWPHRHLYKLEGLVPKMLFHAKILRATTIGAHGQTGWYYAGSHNFTRAAWGRVARQYSSDLPSNQDQFTMNNYELGVAAAFGPEEMPDSPYVFRGKLPVPYMDPPNPYGLQDVPWFQQEYNM
ncbi:hypothetical protein RI367_005601 [Sorochytrium milnesiophthora]